MYGYMEELMDKLIDGRLREWIGGWVSESSDEWVLSLMCGWAGVERWKNVNNVLIWVNWLSSECEDMKGG